MKITHPVAATIAVLCITTFFLSTIIVEMFGSPDAIVAVKSLIVVPGLFLLVPAIAIAGISGSILAKNRTSKLVQNKMKRMRVIAANGILVLIPCALFLDRSASAGSFEASFQIVQGIELLAGAINLALMGMNTRDGLRVTGKLTRV